MHAGFPLEPRAQLRARPKAETATPQIFTAFDCLWADGRDLRERALRARRDQLEGVLAGQDVFMPAQLLADDWAQGVIADVSKSHPTRAVTHSL